MEALEKVSKLSLVAFRPLIWFCSFCRFASIDSASVWEGFRVLQDTASETIKVFLTSYVRNSVQERVVLDEREHAEVRTVTSAVSVLWIWRALVAAADFYIMEPKRQAQPKKARVFRVQWVREVDGRLRGPGFKIVMVSDIFLRNKGE